MIVNEIANGERYKSPTKRFDTYPEYKIQSKREEILYFQFMTEAIISFCDKYKIIETEWIISDLKRKTKS